MSADMKKAVLGQESHPECSNKLPSCDTWTMVVPKGLGKSVIFHKKKAKAAATNWPPRTKKQNRRRMKKGEKRSS